MFEILYVSEAARTRHRMGPLSAERDRYLRHCAEQGGTQASLRLRAQSLLWLAQRMSTADLEGVDAARLQEIIYGESDKEVASTTAATLVGCGRPWLKFMGWWRQSQSPVPFEETLESFVSWMRDERGLTPCTISQWRSRAATFLHWCASTGRDLEGLRPEDIDTYFVSFGAQRWSRISAGHMATLLRVFLRQAAMNGACSDTLADSICSPRRYTLESLPYALSWDDVRRLLETTTTGSEKDVRDRAILMLLAIYGLRRGEVAALRLDQIDWAARQLRIRRLKRHQPQVYPLVASVAQALTAYVDVARPNVPYPEVFIRIKAPRRPIGAAALYDIVSNRLRSLGIQAAHIGPHALRHSCAAKLLADGLSLKEIGDHLGHRSTSATMTYTKIDLAALREVGDFDLGELP